MGMKELFVLPAFFPCVNYRQMFTNVPIPTLFCLDYGWILGIKSCSSLREVVYK